MNKSLSETTDSSADCIAVKRDDDNTRFIVAELLDLLADSRSQKDKTIVTEIIKTIHLLVKEGGNRRNQVIDHPQLLIFLSKFFNNEHHLTRLLASLFHDLSTDENGIRLLLATGVVPILLQSLESSHDDVTNFLLTTLRNCLIGLPEASAEEIQNHNGSLIFISLLLQRHSNRQMNFLADLLLRLSLFNSNAQTYLQTSKLFLQELVTILDETNYSKLSLTLIRMLPNLSSNSNTKSMLIQFNLVPIVERILKENSNYKVHRSCLLTLRNLSDQIIQMENFDSLIVLLVEILSSTNDVQIRIYIVDILSNLSCENQTNKSLLIQHNTIPLLVDLILQSDHHDAMIESAVCTLRHLTGKCLLARPAREDPHLTHLIPHLVEFLHTKEQNWPLLKVSIGLIRNLALTTKNLAILSEHRTVCRIGRLFLTMKSIGERHELFLTTLFVFSRQNNEKCRQIIQDDLIQSGCLPVIVDCASPDHSHRMRIIAQGILDDLAQSESVEHGQMVEEAEKSWQSSQCFHRDL